MTSAGPWTPTQSCGGKSRFKALLRNPASTLVGVFGVVSLRLVGCRRQGSRTAGDVSGVCGGGGHRKDVISGAKGSSLL